MTKQAQKKDSKEKQASNTSKKPSSLKKSKSKTTKIHSRKEDIQAENIKDSQSKGQTKESTLQDETLLKIKVAEESAREWQDKFIRLSAEFDNYRKRTLKEKAELTKQANAELLKDILPVTDDFERGISNLEKSSDIEAIKHGINLIYIKFVEFLRQNGIKEIEAFEKDFDIDYHEAITKIPAPEEKLKGKVIDVIEKGYMLNDKIIRYAKVIVGE